MKLLTTTITLAFVALGMSLGPAMATNPTSCQHSQQQNVYHCTDPATGATATVYNVNSAEAAANAWQNQHQGQVQGQQQGQIAEGGDGGSAYNGGNSVQISNPSTVTTYGASIGLNVSLPIASGVEFNKTMQAAEWLGSNGYKTEAYVAVMSSSVGKRISRNMPDTPQTVCYFSKEDGAVHVYPMSNKAACLASLGF